MSVVNVIICALFVLVVAVACAGGVGSRVMDVNDMLDVASARFTWRRHQVKRALAM